MRVPRIDELGTALSITSNRSTLMMDAIRSPETSVLQRNISEDGVLPLRYVYSVSPLHGSDMSMQLYQVDREFEQKSCCSQDGENIRNCQNVMRLSAKVILQETAPLILHVVRFGLFVSMFHNIRLSFWQFTCSVADCFEMQNCGTFDWCERWNWFLLESIWKTHSLPIFMLK
jgi:hypothetical protein